MRRQPLSTPRRTADAKFDRQRARWQQKGMKGRGGRAWTVDPGTRDVGRSDLYVYLRHASSYNTQ